jgi:hypothetical protein
MSNTYQGTRIGGVGVNPSDPQTLQTNVESGALLCDVNIVTGTITAPDSIELTGEVSTAPATSIKGMAVLTPADTSKAVSGGGGLGLSVVGTVSKIVIWASAAGGTMNYNGAATSSTVPVPTTPLALDCNAADLALLQLLGNATLTVNIVQMG